MKLPDDLKRAILEMPEKEKDKLLLRLIAKNNTLIKQLHFQLIEESGSIEERREDIKSLINESADRYPSYYYSPGYLMMAMRDLSGTINTHITTTKDKSGEAELQLLLLNALIEKNLSQLIAAHKNSRYTFDDYIVKRAKKIVTLISKMHEDYLIEYSDDLQKLGALFNQLKLERTMADANFLIGHLIDPPTIFEQ
jgi:hypothetical protein